MALALTVVALVPTAPMVGSAPMLQADPDVVVRITSPEQNQSVQGQIEITGYAADRRSEEGSGFNENDVQLYLNDPTDPRNLFAITSPTSQRLRQDSPDAAAALGPQFSAVGFRFYWQTCAFPPGRYTLTLFVSSLVVPGARNSASRDVEVAPCAPGTPLVQNDLTTRPSRLLRLDQPRWRTTWLDSATWGDIAVGIDARCRVADTCIYELGLRGQTNPAHDFEFAGYELRVDPSRGQWGFGYAEPGQYTPLLPASESPAIHRGAVPNRLGVIAQGDHWQLFINGEPVGEVHDDRRRWGGVWWGANTGLTDRGVEVEFGNYVLTTPGPPELLAGVLRGE